MTKKEIIFGSAMLTTIIAVFVASLLFTQTTTQPIVEDIVIEAQEKERQWRPVPLGDADPGAGASGVLVVYIYPYQADPGTAYASNLTAGNAYEYNDGLNASCGSNVPYETAFDIVVKVRANTTHAYCSSNSTWVLEWVRANLTCSDLSITATTMEEQNISGTEANDMIFVHYYLQDADGGAGTGFTIGHGQSVNVTHFRFEAYY